MDKKTLKDLEMVLDKKLDQKLDPIKKVQGEHSSKLDALTLDMIDVQKKTDMIADIHDMSKDTKERVDNHEQRIQTIESAS
ncbi:hypothetical protein A2697_04325 [Candidatus Curtissbacteria bacterium RIFCSPHIGHO2_01_FULL_41_44]|nr:MAG: hypothetical protein A2697_04325 [Candidatus Curtissbacteria bacterium RIFCSPHIGHO2_01_FULL_41_44]OGE03127.1 MAG: hypothetical protein A3G16_01235 [Candidatus Curtissbacteria bacterium RIFCSPLOWO2_12_FULL_41_16]